MCEGLVDLHTHTVFSDGVLTPEDLVEEAVWHGLSGIAITDHDTIGGVARAVAAGNERGLVVLSGVEMSCVWHDREVHLLGYGIDAAPALVDELQRMHVSRVERMKMMLDRLREMKVNLSMDDMPSGVGGCMARPHLAQLLLDRGYVNSLPEAYARYIGDHAPAHVEKERLGLEACIELIHGANGVAVLAHPGVSGLMGDLETIVSLGLDGVEHGYPKHCAREEEAIEHVCSRHGLLMSGGSDYHGFPGGPPLGTCAVSFEVVESIQAVKEERDGRVL